MRGVARRGVANTLSGVTTAAAGGRTAGPGRAWLVRMRVLSVGRAAAHHYALVAVLSCTVTRSPSCPSSARAVLSAAGKLFLTYCSIKHCQNE